MVSIEQSVGIIPEPEGESDLHSDFTAGQEKSGEEVATTDDSYMETDAWDRFELNPWPWKTSFGFAAIG